MGRRKSSARGKYKEKAINPVMLVGVMERIETVKTYNIFRLAPSNKYFVVFSDQEELLALTNANLGALVAVKILNQDNNKFSYPIETKTLGGIEVYTIAELNILKRSDLDVPFVIGIKKNGLIYIE